MPTAKTREMLGKSVIITGGASGMGEATAKIVAATGGKVLLADIDAPRGEEVSQAIRDAGGEAYFVHTDISEESSVRDMVAVAISRFGRLDAAFNNGALPPIAKELHELSSEEWSRTISVNLNGVFWSMKYEIQAMLETGGGSIVNTASMAAISAVVRSAEYSAAKGGVISLSRCAAVEYAGRNIRVNAILPGSIRTPMLTKAFRGDPDLGPRLEAQSLTGRFGEPSEIGQAALFLLSDAASYITGVWLPVDGGQSAAF